MAATFASASVVWQNCLLKLERRAMTGPRVEQDRSQRSSCIFSRSCAAIKMPIQVEAWLLCKMATHCEAALTNTFYEIES